MKKILFLIFVLYFSFPLFATNISNTSTGITFTIDIMSNANTSYNYFDNLRLDNYLFTYTDYINKNGYYNFSYPLFQDINFSIRYSTSIINSNSTILCSGESVNGLFYCNATVIDQSLFYNYPSIAICNQNNACNLPTTFQGSYLKQTSSGFNFEGQSFFNVTTVYPITYVSPTPETNSKKYNLNNITIKIYDGNYNFDSCKVNINNLNYTMNYSAHYCTYTYLFNVTNSSQTITFQGFYTILGSESSLEQRTIKVYPIKTKSNPMPAYGLLSLLISFSLLLGNFIWTGDWRCGRGD